MRPPVLLTDLRTASNARPGRALAVAGLLVALLMPLLHTTAGADGLTATTTWLAFGKTANLRPAGMGPDDAGITQVFAPGPVFWDLPSPGGTIYATQAFAGGGPGTRLDGNNIAAYNAAGIPSVFYEAPAHPSVILRVQQGGVAAVTARLPDPTGQPTTTKLSVNITYGQPRIIIRALTALGADGKIQLGVPTPISITVPAMLGAGPVRIDFNEDVIDTRDNATKRIFNEPGPPGVITVIFDPDRAQGFIQIDAVATSGAFMDTNPMSAQLSGLRANGAVLSGAELFSAVPQPTGDAISITKNVSDSNNTIRGGQQVTYNYTVTNNSSGAVSGVVIWDNKLGDILRIQTLAAGASQAAASTTTLHTTTTNYAMVTATDQFGNALKFDSKQVTVTVVNPAIGVSIWQSSDTKVGQDVELKYSVSNDGDTPLTDVSVTDTGFSQTIARLEPGEEREFTHKYKVTREGDQRTATATGTVPADRGGGSVSATDNLTIVTVHPSLAISITASQTKAKQKTKVKYTVTVTNTGDDDLNVIVDDDQRGTIGNITPLKAGEIRTIEFEEEAKSTITHKVEARGTDRFGDVHTANASVTVEVIVPAIKVTAIGSFGGVQSSTKLTVEADKPVSFNYTVTNTGNCELTDVKLTAQGTSAGNYPKMTSGEAKHASSSSSFPDDAQHKVRVTGRDPLRGLVSSQTEITIEVSKGILSDLYNKTVTDGKRLSNEIDRLDKEFDAVVKEFHSIIALHQANSTDPCADPRPPALILRAETLRRQINEKLQTLKTLVESLTKMGLRKIAGQDPAADLLLFVATAAKDSERVRAIQGMRDTWKQLGCADPGSGKDTIVTVSGKVVDKSGNPVAGANVDCGSIKTATDGGGNFSGTRAVSKDDELVAVATKELVPGVNARGQGQSKYTGQDPVRILITIDTSLKRSVTLRGRVLDRRGQALGGASVTAGGVKSVTVDDGSYVLTLTAEVGKPITVGASVTFAGGADPATGGTSVTFKGEEELAVPDITIQGAEVPQTFTVRGVVRDAQGKGLGGVAVKGGGHSTATSPSGGYQFGPVEAVIDQPITIDATIMVEGQQKSGQSALVYKGGDPALAPDIIIADVVQETEFTVSGQVVDANGKAIPGAAVKIGTWSGATGAGGSFTSATRTDPVGTTLTVEVTVTATDGKQYSGSSSVTYNGGDTVSAGTITVAGVEMAATDKPVQSLSVTVSPPSAKIGQTATFTAMATFEDGTTQDVSGLAQWTLRSNRVTGDTHGSVENTATFGGKSVSASASFTCPDDTVWSLDLGKCVESIDEAIGDTADDDEDLCDPEVHLAKNQRLDLNIEETRQLPGRLDASASAFYKGVNDQLANPCANATLARHFRDASSYHERYRQNIKTVQGLSTELIVTAGLCPELGLDTGELLGSISGLGSADPSMLAAINGMRAEYSRLGCDEDEVAEEGDETAEVGADPEVIQSGGAGNVEVCGNGFDDDGDGLQDEGCDQQTNANVVIFVFDSGQLKDDIFRLTVAGITLGSTEKGGARSFPMSLSPGSYNAILTVIDDGGNVGTYTIRISQGDRVLASQQGEPTAGTSVTIPFTVGIVEPPPAASSSVMGSMFMDSSRIDFPDEGDDK